MAKESQESQVLLLGSWRLDSFVKTSTASLWLSEPTQPDEGGYLLKIHSKPLLETKLQISTMKHNKQFLKVFFVGNEIAPIDQSYPCS